MKYLILFCLFWGFSNLEAQKKELYIICAEDEYSTATTLPRFAEQMLADDFNIHLVKSHVKNRHYIEGLEGIFKADLVILSAWRVTLEQSQMAIIKKYIRSGKPLISIRTSSHAFSLRNNSEGPKDSVQWPSFDVDVLGCHYAGHEGSSNITAVTTNKEKSKHPILKNVKSFNSRSWLYNVKPINPKANILLWGQTESSEKEAVAWTYKSPLGSQVFSTTLGHVEDFMQLSFVKLLQNACYAAINKIAPEKDYRFFASYVEEHFPFYTSVLNNGDTANKELPKDVTARGLILKPGQKHFACFDTDLLRYSSIWKDGTIKGVSMAPGSYNLNRSNKKSPKGELNTPTHDGTTIINIKAVPGVEKGKSTWQDPRPAAHDPKQTNRGHLPLKNGQWNGTYLTEEGPVLSYSVGDTEIFENLISRNYKDSNILQRRIYAVNVDRKLFFHIGEFDAGAIATSDNFVFIRTGEGKGVALKIFSDQPCRFVNRGERIELEVDATDEININLLYWQGEKKRMAIFQDYQNKVFRFPDVNRTPPPYWPETTTTAVKRGQKKAGQDFIIDDIELPYTNKMSRNVRLSAIAFFKDGRAALTTFDGDVWIVSGLDSNKNVVWKRFASGLNELQSVVIKNEKVYVFGRQGITRLHDRDKNGEADYYENFCSLPIQTAESREFPMDMKLHPDGSFIIAKGGLRSQTVNPHAGSVIKIAADGKSIKVIATHLREPYLGIDPDNGDIFASDQQGHWTPSTPFHVIQNGAYHGFIPPFVKKQLKPINEPVTWIPHRINQSGSGILKVKTNKLKAIENKLLYLDFNGPSAGIVYYDSADPANAAYVRLKENFSFPLLKGAINPVDKLAYLTGFTIWGSKSPRLSGLARMRQITKNPTIPENVKIFKEGVLLSFHSKIRQDSINPHLFNIERWNYQRTNKYGSGHYLSTGKAGQEKVPVSSVTLAKDGKSLFIAIPNMIKIQQMSLSWRLIDQHGQSLQDSAYFSVNQLTEVSPQQKKLFPPIDFNAPALKLASTIKVSPSIKLGKATVEKLGCISCHSLTSETEGKFGPAWKGLAGSKKELIDGTVLVADDDYLKESIMTPASKVVKGYQAAMPSYEGIIQPHELESIILYLKTLK